jgi:hypothetical protein
MGVFDMGSLTGESSSTEGDVITDITKYTKYQDQLKLQQIRPIGMWFNLQ